MKGFFAVFNNEIFELKEPTDICLTAKNKETGIEKIYDRNGREFKVKVNISNADSNLITNKEFFDTIVTRIKEEKIKEIPTLAPRYRILVDYMLYNNSDNVVIDSGVITKLIDVNNAFMPLGLDPETNELVYRVVKTLDANLDFLYRSDIPFGIMKRPTEKITLYINRVQLQQAKTHAGRFVVGEKDCGKGIVIERTNPNATTEYRFTDTFVTIFDTVMEKLEIAPIDTEMLPRKINIEVSMILNNYFYTSDPNDVLKYVKENIDVDLPKPSIPDDTNGDEENPDDSIGDNKDNADSSDSDNSHTDVPTDPDGNTSSKGDDVTTTPAKPSVDEKESPAENDQNKKENSSTSAESTIASNIEK